MRTDIVGGRTASITQFPWQVFLALHDPGASCGGSILDATHVLTAAHCVVPEGRTVPVSPADINVYAGYSNLRQRSPGEQAVGVSSLRVHPDYRHAPRAKDDVAVLTLAAPLTFSSSVRPISLAAHLPRAGTAGWISGYGQELDRPMNGRLENGSLNWTGQRLLSERSRACRAAVGENSAVVLCAQNSRGSSPCYGDSGGPLVTGNPAVEIGVLSYVMGTRAVPCRGNLPTEYVNLTSPVIRDFIEGRPLPVAKKHPAHHAKKKHHTKGPNRR